MKDKLLPDTVSSINDLTELILDVHSYVRWYTQYATASRVKTKYSEAQPELSPTAINLIRDWSKNNPLSTQSLDTLVTLLESIKNSAPTLTITLAAPATTEVKKALVGWCRQNIASNIIVNFQFNRTILGGMVVRFGSRIFDWSFRRQILDNSQKIPEVIYRV